jgi:hypothetical protein
MIKGVRKVCVVCEDKATTEHKEEYYTCDEHSMKDAHKKDLETEFVTEYNKGYGDAQIDIRNAIGSGEISSIDELLDWLKK